MTTTDQPGEIARHRTAIVRDRLSTPMQALVASGLVDQASKVFDYGCGQGDDIRALIDAGVDAVGWDPHFQPDSPKRRCHAVNLGFVLNVIEDPLERQHVLREAFSLAEKVLAVAVMIVGKVDISAAQPHADGVVTRRGTFQKYFDQIELRTLLTDTLDVEPVAVAPGLFFVFRDEELEQRYLYDRQRHRLRPALPISARPPHRRSPSRMAIVAEHYAEAIDGLVALIHDLGREPVIEEIDPELIVRLATDNVPFRRLVSIARLRCDTELLERVRKERTSEVVLHYALNVLPRSTPFGKLPDHLRHDVRAHFRSHSRAVTTATSLAYQIGDTEQLLTAAASAVQAGIAFIEDDALFLLRSNLVELEPILRLYVGLAERLAGSFETAQILKIHLLSGKLTALTYDRFETTPLPRLRQRIKIDLRHQRVQLFDYVGPNDVHLLYMKGRYLPEGGAHAEKQRAFDMALTQTGLFDFSGQGPCFRDFALTLKKAGYRIEAFSLLRPI